MMLMQRFGNYKVTRIRIQCAEVKDHAKILMLGEHSREYAEQLGDLLCGTSKFYVCKPQDRSPIGKCALCGGKLSYEVQHVAAQTVEPAEFEFAGLMVRRSGPDDLEMAEDWTAADPDHANRVDPRFWLSQSELMQSYLVSDGDGPLYFFTGRLTPGKTLEIHVQFAPDEMYQTPESRHALRGRVMRALIDSTAWLETRMRGVAKEMVFDSANEGLIRFCVKRMGFAAVNGKLSKKVERVNVKA
jgi:hypothetical protein